MKALKKNIDHRDTEAQRKQKRTQRSGAFSLPEQQEKYARHSSWRGKRGGSWKATIATEVFGIIEDQLTEQIIGGSVKVFKLWEPDLQEEIYSVNYGFAEDGSMNFLSKKSFCELTTPIRSCEFAEALCSLLCLP